MAIACGTNLEELVEGTAGGDRSAFEALYDTTSSRVSGLIRRILRDPAQSEEVAQEVFLEIWQKAADFRSTRGKALPWILTVAHRRAVDRVRSTQASRDRDIRSGARQWEVPYDAVAERAETALAGDRVRRAMNGLTPRQREAIELAYFGGHSHAELATILRVPTGTAKTRLRDGMIRLRALLTEEQGSAELRATEPTPPPPGPPSLPRVDHTLFDVERRPRTVTTSDLSGSRAYGSQR